MWEATNHATPVIKNYKNKATWEIITGAKQDIQKKMEMLFASSDLNVHRIRHFVSHQKKSQRFSAQAKKKSISAI
jgi:hypothetical protein